MRKPIAAGGKLLLALAALSAGSAVRAADPDLARCLNVRGKSDRLECFETLARERNPADAATPAPSAMTPPATTPVTEAASRRAEFGLSQVQREERKPTEKRQLESLTVVVAAIRPFNADYWSILTEDGATWRITEARRSFRPPRTGSTITLERASLGSYLLLFDGQAGIRAKRLN